MNKQGFSLLELLIVCTIIAILIAVGFVSFRSATQRARLTEASTQVVADLQRVRSAAQRYNQNASFSTTAATVTSYSILLNNQTYTYKLPAGTQLASTNKLNIGYNAPFGEVNGAPNVELTVSLQNQPTETRKVKVLGVTGKVYIQ